MTSALSRGGEKGKPNRDDPNNFMTGTVTGAGQGVSKDIFVLSQMKWMKTVREYVRLPFWSTRGQSWQRCNRLAWVRWTMLAVLAMIGWGHQCTGWPLSSVTTFRLLRFGMFHHLAWAVGSCKSGPPAARTCYRREESPCIYRVTHLVVKTSCWL